MNIADNIIQRFGGLTAMSKALGHKNVSTVQGWKVRGVIPARRQSEVLQAARAAGIDLSPSDFFSVPTEAELPQIQKLVRAAQ